MTALDAYVAYQFVKILSTPWKKTQAYKLGIIDENGNVLIKFKDLKTGNEKRAYTIFHRLVWNIKRLLDKLPPTKTRIGSFISGLWLLKEHNENLYGKDFNFNTCIEYFSDYLEEHNSNINSGDISKDFSDIFLTESSNNSNIIKKGKYVLVNDIDTSSGPAKTGMILHITKNIKAFDSIAGINVFRVVDGKTGLNLVLSHSDIQKV